MSNYIGVKCPVCNKKFTQTDDVVVCPVCGAPHHRACYAEKRECAFASDHLVGKEWRPPEPELRHADGGGITVCPSCKSSNPKDVLFCQVCGRRMGDTPPRPPEPGQQSWGFPGVMQELNPIVLMYGGLNPDEKIENESVRDLAVYVGGNSAYYLPRFKNIAGGAPSFSFNFSALIFNFAYFFYRKMYVIGTILLVLFIICSIPGVFRAQEMLPQIINEHYGSSLPVNEAKIMHYQSLASLFNSINLMICAGMSFVANKLYYNKAIADVKEIREQQQEKHDEIAYNKALAQKGGVNRPLVVITVSVLMSASFGIAMFFAIQQMSAGGFW